MGFGGSGGEALVGELGRVSGGEMVGERENEFWGVGDKEAYGGEDCGFPGVGRAKEEKRGEGFGGAGPEDDEMEEDGDGEDEEDCGDEGGERRIQDCC